MGKIVSQCQKFLAGADLEQEKIRNFLQAYASPQASVLDVGCGYGRNLKFLLQAGYQAVGVELNSRIVEENKKNSLPCFTPQELKSENKFDVLLLSHVIEHFSPEELKNFFQLYLSRLKPGGLLLIATPLMSPYFFDDFDHIRPYHPESILLLMGSEGRSQMQYHSPYSLRILDLWFRKSPLQLQFQRGRHIPGLGRVIFSLTNLLFLFLYRCSFRVLSRKDGWAAAFQLEK